MRLIIQFEVKKKIKLQSDWCLSQKLVCHTSKTFSGGAYKNQRVLSKANKIARVKQSKKKMAAHGSSCGACKFLRRKCNIDCVFSPYFSYEQASSHFAAVHKVFGASNVSKHLLSLPLHQRSAAAITISYEALSRMCDPVYGCVSHIFALQQQVSQKYWTRFFLKKNYQTMSDHVRVLGFRSWLCKMR